MNKTFVFVTTEGDRIHVEARDQVDAQLYFHVCHSESEYVEVYEEVEVV